jgi:hypothetical protein
VTGTRNQAKRLMRRSRMRSHLMRSPVMRSERITGIKSRRRVIVERRQWRRQLRLVATVRKLACGTEGLE